MTEIEKYQGLYGSAQFAHYGHSNHGRAAFEMVAAWSWDRALDVGCGWNEWAKEMRGRHPGREVIGVDFACQGADMLLDVTEPLPWPNKHFDVLTAFDMLEHLRPEDVPKVLSEFARVSKQFVFSIAYRASVNTWQGENLHPTVQPPEWWREQMFAQGAYVLQTGDGYWVGEWQQPKTVPAARPLSDLGKTWCLVGNGPSVLKAERGAEIDAHDVVVRFNDYVTRRFERVTGVKTSLWAFMGNAKRPEGVPPPGLRVHGEPGCELPHTWDIPRSYYDELKAELRARGGSSIFPSAGYVVIRYLLETGAAERLSLIGFDHFGRGTCSQHHYWNKGVFAAPKEHNGQLEAAMLAELHATNLIYLDRHESA